MRYLISVLITMGTHLETLTAHSFRDGSSTLTRYSNNILVECWMTVFSAFSKASEAIRLIRSPLTSGHPRIALMAFIATSAPPKIYSPPVSLFWWIAMRKSRYWVVAWLVSHPSSMSWALVRSPPLIYANAAFLSSASRRRWTYLRHLLKFSSFWGDKTGWAASRSKNQHYKMVRRTDRRSLIPLFLLLKTFSHLNDDSDESRKITCRRRLVLGTCENSYISSTLEDTHHLKPFQPLSPWCSSLLQSS